MNTRLLKLIGEVDENYVRQVLYFSFTLLLVEKLEQCLQCQQQREREQQQLQQQQWPRAGLDGAISLRVKRLCRADEQHPE